MATTADSLILTRRSLLSRLKNWEDQESCKDFFDTYSKLIYAVAIKAGLTDTEAQEVLQETVIVVAKKLQEFRYDPGVGSSKSWLLHTTQSRIDDQFRKRRREAATSPARTECGTRTSTTKGAPYPAGFDLESIWDREWEENLFDVAAEKVKRQVRAQDFQIFDLCVMKHWPVRKIARTLGVNVGQIYLAKHRVSRRIKREIKALETKAL